MKIVVIGGSGLIGSRLVAKLREQGHEAVPASPNSGVNTLTGEGLAEVLKSALGNAEDLRAPNVGGLVVKDARVDGGPMFKRMRPRARGMAHVVARRSAHISVTVE